MIGDRLEQIRGRLARLAEEQGSATGDDLRAVERDLRQIAGVRDAQQQSGPVDHGMDHDEDDDDISFRMRRREALVELSALGTSSTEDLLGDAARIVANALHAEFSKVMELLPDGDLLVRAGHGWPPGIVGVTRDAKKTGSQAGYTMMTGESVIINDLREETRFDLPQAVKDAGVISSITAPIPGKQRPFGVLEVDSTRPRAYSYGDLRFLAIAANIIGAAISIARFERALKLQQEVSLILNGTRLIKDAMPGVLKAIGENLDFRVVGMWREDRYNRGNIILKEHWIAASIHCSYPGSRYTYRPGEGCVGEAWQSGKPFWAGDMSQNEQFERHQQLKKRGLAAGMCFPVPSQHGVVGAIELFKDEPFEPDADMLSTLESITQQIGLFVQRVRIERQYRDRERAFRALAENSPDIVGRYAPSLRRLYVNPAMAQLAGADREEMMAGIVGDQFHDVDLSEWKAALLRAFETGEEQSVEVYFPSGPTIVQNRMVPEFGDNGNVMSVLVVGRDVTDLKHAQQEADARYEQLRALVDNTPVGLVIVDKKTSQVVLANQEYERLVNRRRRPGDPVTGQRRSTARRPDGHVLTDDELPLRRALNNGESIEAEELTMEHPDGTAYPTIATAAPIWDDQGNVTAAIVVLQNISRLRELDRLRSDFLSMVGHEMRTPLAIIRLAVGSLMAGADEVTKEELTEALETVDQQATRIADMLSNLKDVAQIQTGNFSVHTVPSDLLEVLNQAREDMQKMGVETIRIHTPERLPEVKIDRLRILQVVENLLNNAAKYGAQGEPIDLSVEQTESELTVSVSNRGRGIPRSRQTLLFQKFSRLGKSREEAGTGLGLVIAKGIVEAHGGRIWVNSSSNAPLTTFSFTLPLERPVSDAGNTPQLPTMADQRPKRRVLAVDEETQILRHLKRILDRAGYETITTKNPSEVAVLLQQHHPDVLLLDVMLPGTTGFEVFESIKGSGVPVIFISARDTNEDRQRAKQLGAVAYLAKPVNAKVLVSSISAALERMGKP